MEVLGPKGPVRFGGIDARQWALNQLVIAAAAVDQPGGGLNFATQAIGQVRVALEREDAIANRESLEILARAESHAIRRDFEACREALGQARERLPAGD